MDILLLFSLIVAAILILLGFLNYRETVQRLNEETSQQNSIITKLRESLEALRKKNSILETELTKVSSDAITHLPSWQLFVSRLEQGIKESLRYQFTLGILLIELNDLNIINEALGSAIGNQVLREAADRIQKCIREVDSLARQDNHRFVLLLSQLLKPESAAIVAQRILQTFMLPFKVDNHQLYINGCIGIAVFPADGEDADSLIVHAESALNVARKNEKPQYHFYQEDANQNSQRELELINRIKSDDIYQAFIIYYQPIMDISKQSIFCMDTLLCWQDEQYGFIDSEQLFHYAERERMLNDFSTWMFTSACKQFLKWRSLGFTPPYLGISLSFKQLENNHFVYELAHIMQALSFNPAWLLVSIKEDASHDLFINVSKNINRLQYLGVCIALDNFGSGPFSFSYLKYLTLQFLRLDPELIRDIEENPETSKFIEALVNFAKELSIEIIIPGIDSSHEIDLLKDLKVKLMQGKTLSPPLHENEVVDKLMTV